MNLDQFLTKYANKSNDYDGYYGAQCFDLFQFYNRDVVGAPFVTGAAAKDIWNTYPRAFYEQIANGATNYPKKGDVLVWGEKYGIYGHVAIASEDGNPQNDSFTVLSQNDPVGVPSIYKTYNDWKGVLGWLRPKAQVTDPLADCLRQHGELVAELDALKKEHAKCPELKIEVSRLNIELEKVKIDNAAKQSEISTLSRRNDELEKVLLEIKASVSRL